MAKSKISSRRLRVLEKWQKALDLRMEGKEWTEIAKILGYRSHASAIYAVSQLLKDTLQEKADHFRSLTLKRLTKVLSVYWPKMLLGDTTAANVVLRTVDSMRHLLGLDAPLQVEASGPDGKPMEVAHLDADYRSIKIGNETLDEVVRKIEAGEL